MFPPCAWILGGLVGSLVPAHPLSRHSEGLGGSGGQLLRYAMCPPAELSLGGGLLVGSALPASGLPPVGGIRKHFVTCEREAR